MAALTRLTDRLIVGAPHDAPAPFMGPVIDNEAAEHLLARVEALVASGAKVVRPWHASHPTCRC